MTIGRSIEDWRPAVAAAYSSRLRSRGASTWWEDYDELRTRQLAELEAVLSRLATTGFALMQIENALSPYLAFAATETAIIGSGTDDVHVAVDATAGLLDEALRCGLAAARPFHTFHTPTRARDVIRPTPAAD